MADEDPFSIFSDEDEESVEETSQQPQSRLATLLRETANSRLSQDSPMPSTASAHQSLDTTEGLDFDLSSLPLLRLKWQPPLYIGPISLVSALPVGGGRGYVASRNLSAGTLILVEEIAMTWPPEQLGRTLGLISLQHLLRLPLAKCLVRDMEEFHPTKTAVDHRSPQNTDSEQVSDMIDYLRTKYQDDELEYLVQLAKGRELTSSDGTFLDTVDILRLLLALRYNGLESGVYRHVAMLNHSCQPNCVKLLPEGELAFSEVRTTRSVRAGETLTISYLPRIMSHASRRNYLWKQHRFDIGADLKGNALQMELVGGQLPLSYHDRVVSSPTTRIETATTELEKMMRDIQNDNDDHGLYQNSWDTLITLEQSLLELYHESKEQLQNDDHILLIPILSLHFEVSEIICQSPTLSTTFRLGLRGRQVLTAHRLLQLQSAHLGKDHFDLARTNLDLANGISELLSRSPKTLFDLNQASLSSFAEWASLEKETRLDHHRIKQIYPFDTGFHIHARK